MHFFNQKNVITAIKIIDVSLIFLLVATIIVLVPRAHTARASSPFGGKVTSVYYCSCSNNYRLTVSPPVGGTFMYVPGSTIVYEFKMIPVVGVWLLGLYGTPVACVVPAGKYCVTSGVYPMIEMTGTSM